MLDRRLIGSARNSSESPDGIVLLPSIIAKDPCSYRFEIDIVRDLESLIGIPYGEIRMSTITVTTACGTAREFDSRQAAREGKRTQESLCDECSGEDIDITAESKRATVQPAVGEGQRPAPAEMDESLPTDMPQSVRMDPLDIVPDYMIAEVEGQPTINKRGYALIANHFDIVVQSEMITIAGETDHEYAEFKATSYKKGESPEEGYTGHATARASEDRRGIEDNLNEMAETRAMKRAVAWASGLGLLASEEMAEYLDE